MKPQTVARRAARRAAERMSARESRIERLRTLAERDGPDSIWAELLDIDLTVQQELAA